MSDPLHTLPPETVEPALPPEITTFDPNEDAAIENQEEGIRRAAFRAAPGKWKDIPLFPWSLDRDLLWSDLRVHANAPEWGKILELVDLAPILPDAVRILYISTLDDDALDEARRHLPELSRRAHAWANEHIGFGGAMDAITAALDIYNASRANEPDLVTEGHGVDRGK